MDDLLSGHTDDVEVEEAEDEEAENGDDQIDGETSTKKRKKKTSKGEGKGEGAKRKRRVLPPRTVILGKGKFLGRKLLWPRTGKEWLAWGHILQKMVENIRLKRIREKHEDKKEVEVRDEKYFEVRFYFVIIN